MDIVLYSNIKSEVILLAAIKEGTKILKGMKYSFMNNKCNLHSVQETNELLRMRSILFSYKTLFDELIIKISEKWSVDVTENNHKKIFENRVKVIFKLLDTSDNDKDHKSRCFLIKKELEPITDAYIIDSKYNTFFLEEYYLFAPIKNIHRLYYDFEKYFM